MYSIGKVLAKKLIPSLAENLFIVSFNKNVEQNAILWKLRCKVWGFKIGCTKIDFLFSQKN